MNAGFVRTGVPGTSGPQPAGFLLVVRFLSRSQEAKTSGFSSQVSIQRIISSFSAFFSG